MSLHGLFVRNYRGQGIYNMEVRDITADQWNDGLARIQAMPSEALARTRVFKGHMLFGLHEYLPGESDYITFLRHPVSRVVSHYKMIRALGAFPADHTLDPSKPLWNLGAHPDYHRALDNYQVRAIAGIDFELPFGAITRDHLRRAQENLDRHFQFVGLTERFDLSLLLMRQVCGWKWRHYIADNVATDPSPRLPQSVLDQLCDLNRYDLELYRYAEEKFDRLVDQYGWKLQAETQAFRLGNRLHRLLHRGRHWIKQRLGGSKRATK